MGSLDKAYESAIDRAKQKMARDALNGAIGLIYSTHSLPVAKAIIQSVAEEALDY